MLHPSTFAVAIAVSVSLFVVPFEARAESSDAWLSATPITPIEQRVAVASGPDRTTIWTSLRFDSSAGPVAIVIPVPPGASLDRSSDAWFEALETATAPRVLPPANASATCAGAPSNASAVDVVGNLDHTVTLSPDAISVLADAGALETWASANGLAITAPTKAQLEAAVGESFLAARFTSLGGQSLSPTFRVVLPTASAFLPLALTRANGGDLDVTAFFIGAGRASLPTAIAAPFDLVNVKWEAATGRSTYRDERRASLLAAGPSGVLVEDSSHTSLVETAPVLGVSGLSIDAVLSTYFERASAYGALGPDPTTCAAVAAAALGSQSIVAASCPRAALGVVGGQASCVESSAGEDIDPAVLRCGAEIDDLAVALSGMKPGNAWISRVALRIAAGDAGVSLPVVFASGDAVTPVREASSVDFAGCGGSGSSGSEGAGSGSTGASMMSGGPGTGSNSAVAAVIATIPVAGALGGEGASSNSRGGGGDDSSGSGAVDPGDVASAVADTGCDCGGTSETSSSSSDSGCGSDTSSASSSDDSSCSGSSEGSSSGDSCSSGSDVGDAGCSGASGGEDCSVAGSGVHRTHLPKLSAMGFLAMLGLAPLRRAGRRKRRPVPSDRRRRLVAR